MLTLHTHWAVEVQVFGLILDSSVGLMSGHSVSLVTSGAVGSSRLESWLSAEEDNFSPVRFEYRLLCAQASDISKSKGDNVVFLC